MAAFIKNLQRFLSPKASGPSAHLAAFGKHPGWNDHTDDLGLDTDELVTAKRLLYIQGISQNIDSGAWEPPAERLDLFRHDFLWYMPGNPGTLLAGRLWSSSDGKGRDKYPMVLCSQLTDLSARFAAQVVLPFLAQVHERCAAESTAEGVREMVDAERAVLRARISDPLPGLPLTAREVAHVAGHPQMHAADAPSAGSGGGGFHRIVYGFASGLSAFRTKSSSVRRPEQLRLPACGMPANDALLFWLRFALTFVDASAPLLLLAPDQGDNAPWVDLIAGEPAPQNLYCIKAGTKSIPYTSDIPYTLDLPFVRAIDNHLSLCATAPESAPMPPWPI